MQIYISVAGNATERYAYVSVYEKKRIKKRAGRLELGRRGTQLIVYQRSVGRETDIRGPTLLLTLGWH